MFFFSLNLVLIYVYGLNKEKHSIQKVKLSLTKTTVAQSVGKAAGLCENSIPKGGFQEFSDCSLGWNMKAPKRFSEGKPEAVG